MTASLQKQCPLQPRNKIMISLYAWNSLEEDNGHLEHYRNDDENNKIINDDDYSAFIFKSVFQF